MIKTNNEDELDMDVVRQLKSKKAVVKEIMKKNSVNPYLVNNTIYDVNVDYDVFPYPKWFKGEARNDTPKVADREAGWIPRNTYKVKDVKVAPENDVLSHRICFQGPLSTVYPCYSQDNSYIMLNKACLIDYR